jgi:hypothetical protein
MANSNVSQTPTSGVAAGKPQPQTTAEPAGGPFIRHTQEGRRTQYQAVVGFNGLVSGPTVAAPGYARGYRLKTQFVTGGGTGGVIAAGVGGQDWPFSFYSLIQLKDSFGTPLITGPGYEVLKLIPLYSGQFGTDETQDVQNLPSWTGVTAASGAGTFASYLPFEFAKGYGVISAANASLLPSLEMNTSTANTGFSTLPSVLPAPQEQLDLDFYWLPEGVAVEPPGIGTTCQWLYQPANPPIPNGGTQLVQFPRLGGYLTVIIAEMRDSTGARVDGWPARPKLYVDGVPLIDSDINTTIWLSHSKSAVAWPVRGLRRPFRRLPARLELLLSAVRRALLSDTSVSWILAKSSSPLTRVPLLNCLVLRGVRSLTLRLTLTLWSVRLCLAVRSSRVFRRFKSCRVCS